MNGPDPEKGALYDRGRAEGMSHDEAVTFAESGGRSAVRGVFRGALAPALRGPTFGLGDEIVGGIRGALSRDLTVGQAIEAERGEYDRFSGEHPVASVVTEIGTGALTGAGAFRAATKIPAVARAAAALRSAPRVARGGARLAGAAAEGGVYGIGAAEGDIGQRLGGGAEAAAYSVPFTVGFAGAGRLAGLGRQALSRGDDAVRTRASDQVRRSIERSGRSVDDIASEATKAADKPVALVDVGGENARGLARLVGNIPGEGRETMYRRMFTRAEGQGARVIDDLERAFGQEADDVIQMADDIMARRAEQAKPLYEAAYEKSVPRSVLGDVMTDRTFQDAYERGVRIAKREGVDIKPLGELLAGESGKAGGVIGDVEIPVQAVDYMKRGLDDAIESGRRSSKGMGRQEARGIRSQLNDLLERVDNEVPEYAQARATYAGDSAMLEALDEGRKVLRMRPNEIRKSLESLTESEADMFRRGALEELRYRVSSTKDTSDAVRRIFGDEEMRGRLARLFPSADNFDDFARRMGTESEMQISKNTVVAGSRPFPMQAEAADFGRQLVSAASQGKLGFIRAVGRYLKERVWEKTAGEVADILSTGAGEGSLDDVLRELAASAQRGSRRSQRAAVAGGVTGGVTGGVASRGDASDQERTMSDADLWDLKVSQGMSQDEATEYVEGRRGLRRPALQGLR